MIEKAPQVSVKEMAKAVSSPMFKLLEPIVNGINNEYEYWDSVKYKKIPEGCTPQQLWINVKLSRYMKNIVIWDRYGIHFSITDQMQRMCHEFDMIFGSFWESKDGSNPNEKKYYIASSLMEEAFYSSQIEGASTTRVAAKEMLRKKKTPRDKSQQMIVNNYNTIQYIVEHQNEPLTEKSLLHIHRLMTEKTLDNPENAGCFRTNDEIVVADVISNEIVHRPPSFEEIPNFVKDLCNVFNRENSNVFIHPIIRGIIIHFMVAYMHPFVDGNGRTARALFYWFMLKEKYWLTEYMSISRVIARSKKSYEKSFLYTENDDNDMGYFIAYNLRVLKLSFQQLHDYIQRKQMQKKASNIFMFNGNINERQAQILQLYVENPFRVVTVKEVQDIFSVAPMTARRDLSELVSQGYLEEIAMNKIKRGYIKGEKYEDLERRKQTTNFC